MTYKSIRGNIKGMSGEHQAEVLLTLICTLSLGIGFFGSLFDLITEDTARYFYVASYLSGGYFGLTESVQFLMKGKCNVDVLMILAAAGAAFIDYWLEGAMLLFLFSLSNTLQHFAMGRSRNAIRSLMKLRPAEALVRSADGTEQKVPVEALKLGDIIVVKPGERIPIDGTIRSGKGTVDQSAITGESAPVFKEEGAEVFAATFNENGILEIKVTRGAGDTTLAKIIKMVEQAQNKKAETQRFLDEFESKYAISVIISTIALILIPYYILDQPFDPVFYRAMTILVVASPCALIISTPASILSAIANAARSGILFKGGAYLEQAAGIQAFAFDKTGTLTKGKPAVTDIIPISGSENELLRLAASAEEHSEHHLAEAIVNEARRRKVEFIRAEDVQAIIGKGISAKVNGAKLKIGNRYLFEDNLKDLSEDFNNTLEEFRNQGKTVIYVSKDDSMIGAMALADQIREQAAPTILELADLGIVDITILTGDSLNVAQNVAEQLNITNYHAGLLPDQKVELIEKLSQKKAVAMVGDGVNDAPALAASHLGIAMGAAGTDVALETADVVLMSDDLTKLPYMIRLARRAKTVVWQNIIFSLAVIAMLVSSVFLFDLPITLGVIGHEGSTLLVVLNGLRLLKNS
ncbi:heavy metal translocating P-type ATPase [Gracilimonas halophila]|uniref:Heavy metal translocating P-type ATPase n=2 Tax=Gracilimonas halophila TaxID=1834464 RepID=A0ABW5JIP4_9BACT